ncbi:MAG: cell division protein ZapB [Deltaproteobacteria bacterium]|nr:cell division protein ZapB [Deltaproteobacteria bacterium]
MNLEKFDILEEKVGQLAERYSELKNQYDGFGSTIAEKDRELSALKEKIRILEEEKGLIKARLDKIIANLESVAFHS